jgi:hypothetical protein
MEAILNERGKGSIAQWMEAQSIIETVNDGDNYYGQIEINLQDPSLPTPATNTVDNRFKEMVKRTSKFPYYIFFLKLVMRRKNNNALKIGRNSQDFLIAKFP